MMITDGYTMNLVANMDGTFRSASRPKPASMNVTNVAMPTRLGFFSGIVSLQSMGSFWENSVVCWPPTAVSCQHLDGEISM